MASISEIVVLGLRKIGVAAHDEPAQAHDIVAGVDAWNDLMAEAVLSGHVAAHTVQVAGDTFALGAGLKNPAAAAVAVRLAAIYGVEPGRQVRADAAQFLGRQDSHAGYVADPALLTRRVADFDTL